MLSKKQDAEWMLSWAYVPAVRWPILQPGLPGRLGAIQTPGYSQDCLLLIDPWYQGRVETYGFLLIHFTNRHIVRGAEKELRKTLFWELTRKENSSSLMAAMKAKKPGGRWSAGCSRPSGSWGPGSSGNNLGLSSNQFHVDHLREAINVLVVIQIIHAGHTDLKTTVMMMMMTTNKTKIIARKKLTTWPSFGCHLTSFTLLLRENTFRTQRTISANLSLANDYK